MGIVLDNRQRSPLELVILVETELRLDFRWELIEAVSRLARQDALTRSQREYFRSALAKGEPAKALHGEDVQDRETLSSIDVLLARSTNYRSSEAFQSMIDFMGRFRDYAPYNNMLVRVQNPSCSFYATAKDWHFRFLRTLKEDARPMLILAPMHPLMLVYDIDQTEGADLPRELVKFAQFHGEWDERWLERLNENAAGHRIRVQFKPLSSTHGGFATLLRADGDWKMRIVVHGCIRRQTTSSIYSMWRVAAGFPT